MMFAVAGATIASPAFVARTEAAATGLVSEYHRANPLRPGMPKAQLLSCAGVPDRSRQEASAEYFTYENERIYGYGGSSVGVFGGSGHFGTGVSVPLSTRLQSDYCEATFTLVDGRVAELVYNSSRGGRFAECARIIETCLTYATGPQQN